MLTNLENLELIIKQSRAILEGITPDDIRLIVHLPEITNARDIGLLKWLFSEYGIEPLKKINQIYLAQMQSDNQDKGVSDIMVRFNAIHGVDVPEIK